MIIENYDIKEHDDRPTLGNRNKTPPPNKIERQFENFPISAEKQRAYKQKQNKKKSFWKIFDLFCCSNRNTNN